MAEKKVKNNVGTQQLTDKEAENVRGGMKIVVSEQPSFFKTILRFLFGIKDKK